MPNRHRIPTYRLHKASGQAIVTLPDGSGGRRDVLLGKHGSAASKAEYLRVIAEWEASGRRIAPAKGNAGDITIYELMAAFVKHAQTYYVRDGKRTAEVDCIKSAVRPLGLLYGHTMVKDFGPLAAKALLRVPHSGMTTLTQHPGRHIVVVMDQAKPHTSKLTKAFIENKERLPVFSLPPYSPEWNPDEKVWNHLKHHELKAHRAINKQELYELTEEKLANRSDDRDHLQGLYFRCCVAELLR